MPFNLLVLLDLEELESLDVVLYFWVREVGISDQLAVKFFVHGSETRFGLAKDEREKIVLAAPFDCCTMACKGRELLGGVSHGFEGGLSHNFIERDGSHPSSYHSSDVGHDRHDCRHVCAVCALKRMTCSSPRRPLFLHALSFECTSKLCSTFLNQFSEYFHI